MSDQKSSDDKSNESTPLDRLTNLLERAEPALTRLAETIAREHKSAGVWSIFKRGGIVLMFLLGFLVWAFAYGTAFGVHPEVVKPTLAQVEIDGPIGAGHAASADLLVPMLKSLCDQPMVRGIVLHIDSPGGSPGDAERIGAQIDACKTLPVQPEAKGDAGSGKPGKRQIVAIIDGLGASAAYMIAIHADRIVVNPTGMVGSIGVIIEGLKFDGLMQKVGVSSYAYASGDLKTMLSPYAQDTPQQRAVAKSLADDAAEVFKKDVIEHRPGLVQSTPDLWSGRVWVAEQAKAIGLVDQVGLLEPTERDLFKGLNVQTFRPQKDVRSLLSMSAWVKEFRAQVFASEGTMR